MKALLNDVRYGLRRLYKQPGFALIAGITLAIGIGANTAIFSIVNGVLLKPLPLRDPSQLVMVWHHGAEAAGGDFTPLSYADLLDWRAQSHVFESIAGFQYGVFTYVGNDSAEQVRGITVSSNFFSTLGAPVQLGRDFQQADEKVGVGPSVILSDKFWRTHFGADPNVVGRSINVSGSSTTIVGVMSSSIRYPSEDVAMWRVSQLPPPTRRGPYFISGLARLKPGVTIQQAVADTGLAQSSFDNGKFNFNVLSVEEYLVGDIRPALLALLVAVTLVLLIAAVNVANLTLVRTASRVREISIRTALGARRKDIIRQLLTESLLLAVISGVAGALLSVWAIKLIVKFAPPGIPRLDQTGIDPVVLGWTALVSLVTCGVFGIVPALQASRQNLNQELRNASRNTTENFGKRYWRNALVVSELALAVMLLVGGGLLIKSLWKLQRVNVGVNPDRLLTMQVRSDQQYTDDKQVRAFYSELLARVKSLPGVRDAAVGASLPPDLSDFSSGFTIEGQPQRPTDEPLIAYFIRVSPEYFGVFNIPLRRGRLFEPTDQADKPLVVIINETFRRKFFGEADPVNKRINLGNDKEPSWHTIAGVVADVRYNGIAQAVQPAIYLTTEQAPASETALIIKTDVTDPLVLTGAVRNELHQMNPQLPIAEVATMDQRLATALSETRFRTFLIAIFATLALVLACLGIYGVISYSVAQRTHEIGVRMALGAQTRDVVSMVVKQAVGLALTGIALGLTAAFFLSGVMTKLLFGVTPRDLPTFALTALILAATALTASYLPARRAAKVDPLIALRHE
ncbi:MAG TPA: ABC transporter permease [Pyrinomonadaceae bacterium]|nr:ABC transporter permease [Pyrinomonadaceae bacterium]